MQPRIGFVAVIRPLFKGDSPTAALRSRNALEELGGRLGFRVVAPQLTRGALHPATEAPLPSFAVHDLDSSEQAARWAEAAELDMLLVQHTTFATGDLLAPLMRTPLPVGIWALPERSGGRGADAVEGFDRAAESAPPGITDRSGSRLRGSRGPLPLNSLCGLNMTLSALESPEMGRQGPVKWFYGEARSSWFEERLEPTLIALRGLRALRGARVLQIGGTAPGFYGLEECPALDSVTLDTRPLSELFDRIAAVSRAEAAERARQWSTQEPAIVDAEAVGRAAAVELALRDMAAEGNYHALALRCWPELPDRCTTMACAAVGRLGDSGLPTACEGDVMGALSMLALQGAADAAPLLMDLSDIDVGGLLFWHCGNAPRSWAAGATLLANHFNRDELGTVRDMTLRDGPATGFRLLEGGRKALIFDGSFGSERAPGYDGVRGWLRHVSWNGEPISPRRFVASVLDRRLPHHFAFAPGQVAPGLREMCGWLRATPVGASDDRATL